MASPLQAPPGGDAQGTKALYERILWHQRR
jgi:hypothetical protein